MPHLAAFPKAFMDPLCVDGAMTIRQWIELASTLGVEGLEFYTGFLELRDPAAWAASRSLAADHGMAIPMLCASPDFTHPDEEFRRREIDQQKRWIDGCAELGGSYCRVLSGQRRPEVSREAGLAYAAGCIEACLPHAAACGVTLILENHYKDGTWRYPEFAQPEDIYLEIIGQIDSPHFGVQYDPSNAFVGGFDPVEFLAKVRHRVVTMHASDRYLAPGATLDDLATGDGALGYASALKHGETGRGMNDYDAIFQLLAGVQFDGWISVEAGLEGVDEIARSVQFLRRKREQYFTAPPAR